MGKYFSREKDRDIRRRELYLKSKCETQGHGFCSDEQDPKAMQRMIGAAGSMNY